MSDFDFSELTPKQTMDMANDALLCLEDKDAMTVVLKQCRSDPEWCTKLLLRALPIALKAAT